MERNACFEGHTSLNYVPSSCTLLDPSPGPGEEAESKPRIEKMFGRRAALGARSVSAVGSEPGLRPPPLYRGVQPLARPRP